MKANNGCRLWLASFTALLLALFSLAAPASQAAAATGTIALYFNEGPAGTPNTLTGSGFTPGTTFTFRFATNIITTGAVDSSGKITVNFTVPVNPGGQYPVTVTTESDTSNTEYFTIIPDIALDITTGRSGGQIKVTGSGFKAGASVTIIFDDTSLGGILASASGTFTNAVFTIPASPGGRHSITGKDATSASPAVSFNILQPEIWLGQNSGRVGDQVSVNGSGFQSGSSVSIFLDSVSMGNVLTDADGAFSNAKVAVPYSSAGEHTVKGKDAFGFSGGASFNILEPSISLSQDSGRVGDQITVSGLGFPINSSVAILFDNSAVANVMSNTRGAFSNVVITIPSGAGGAHIIAGKDAINTSPGVKFSVLQSITISPLTGAVGDVAKISGSGFTKKSTVTVDFDGTIIKINAVIDAYGAFAGSFEVPDAAAGKHNIHVYDNSGTQDMVTFTVTPRLTIAPENGPAGTMVKASGAGFNADRPVVIKYNGAPVTVSPASINTDSRGRFFATFEVPASLPGIFSVEASDAAQSAGAKFTAVLSATISQITSRDAPGHIGMKLTINGVGFRPNAKITVTRATIQQPLAVADTNAQGLFSINFTIPPSPSGQHHIIVTDGVNSREFEFFIENEPPAMPLLLQPDTARKTKQPLLFDWKDVSDPSGVTYALQIARDEKFESVFVEQAGLKDSEFAMTKNKLKAVTKDNPYYWRVKSIDGAYNESKWSEIRLFSTGFVITLPNGEPELTLSALTVYGISAFVLFTIFFSLFVIRRRSHF